ncbi:MAG: tRNA (guanosine(46)-N7)-methyltransferase TrmB [Anaerolineae bacterium]|nr:tRNA (guanosine(46)-N7)-methyltransferase TrmB [Anaerolineae bacterium]
MLRLNISASIDYNAAVMSSDTAHPQKLNSQMLPWPVDWAALLGAARPLILEIGFGHGDFLLHLARQHPDASIIGLEISNRCLTLVEDRLQRHNLHHVRVIHTPAETALHHLFEPGTLDEAHINFPDPWFKTRHEHRRLMQRDTLDALVSRLKPEGRLYLATDIHDYAVMAADLLAATPGLDNRLDTPWANTMDGRVVTKYERKARQEGRACYYFAYQRNHQPAPPVPVIQELPMPHVVFETPLSLEAMRAAFQPIEYAYGDTHINISFIYLGERALLFDIYVKEPTIDQRVALTLVARERPDEYTLQLSMIGHPRPTTGIHAATNLLADWLIGLHPDTKVLKRKTQVIKTE